MYQQGNSRAVNARILNFQYDRPGATDLSRDVYCPALEWAYFVEIASRDIGEKVKQNRGETK